MENLFEQQTRMLENIHNQWRELLKREPELPLTGGEPFRESLKALLKTMNSTYSSNADAWNAFLEQTQYAFFKMYEQSPFFNEAAKTRMAKAFGDMDKAQKTIQEMVKTNFSIIERLLGETE